MEKARSLCCCQSCLAIFFASCLDLAKAKQNSISSISSSNPNTGSCRTHRIETPPQCEGPWLDPVLRSVLYSEASRVPTDRDTDHGLLNLKGAYSA